MIVGYSHSLNDHVSHLRTVKEEEPLCKEREMLLCPSPRSPFLSFKLSSRRTFVRCSSADDEVFVVLLGSVGTGKGFGSVGKDPSGELYSLGPGFEGPASFLFGPWSTFVASELDAPEVAEGAIKWKVCK